MAGIKCFVAKPKQTLKIKVWTTRELKSVDTNDRDIILP